MPTNSLFIYDFPLGSLVKRLVVMGKFISIEYSGELSLAIDYRNAVSIHTNDPEHEVCDLHPYDIASGALTMQNFYHRHYEHVEPVNPAIFKRFMDILIASIPNPSQKIGIEGKIYGVFDRFYAENPNLFERQAKECDNAVLLKINPIRWITVILVQQAPTFITLAAFTTLFDIFERLLLAQTEWPEANIRKILTVLSAGFLSQTVSPAATLAPIATHIIRDRVPTEIATYLPTPTQAAIVAYYALHPQWFVAEKIFGLIFFFSLNQCIEPLITKFIGAKSEILKKRKEKVD